MTKDSIRRWIHITRWRVRYMLLDTSTGKHVCLGLALVFALFGAWQFYAGMHASAAGAPRHAFWIQIVVAIVAALISYALIPKQPDAVDQVTEAPRLEDGAGVRMVFGEVWITDPAIIGWRKMGTKTIRGKKCGFNGRPIIGYWYKQLFHFVLCRGPVDAVLEFRGGDKTAWRGEMTGTSEVQINRADLWGGQGTGGEGGIEGPMEFLFGDAAQMPSAYLASALDPKQPAYRGLLTALYKGGLWGAFSPYPKAASFKVRRILEGWERPDGAWYPERAEIALERFNAAARPWRWLAVENTDSVDRSATDFDDSSWNVGYPPFGDKPWPGSTSGEPGGNGFSSVPATVVPQAMKVWMRTSATFNDLPSTIRFQAFVDNDCRFYVNGVLVVQVGGAIGGYYDVPISTSAFEKGENQITVEGWDRHSGPGNWFWFDWRLEISAELRGANPAHILYQSITDSWMGAEPETGISEASFRAAADTLYAESFGLCTEWDSTNESVEQFQQRICDVIGANLSRSPVDGLWYLDLIRSGYDNDSLPILNDDDIIEYTEQPGTMQDAVNQVIVEWRDPQRRENRSTAPVQSLGAIQAVGAVVGEVATYHEIPSESLALRVAARNLQSKSRPLRRSSIKVTRIAHAWRPGQVFRLQSAKRGIADMTCRIGDADRGTLRSGAISLTTLQDVFGLPQAVYVMPDPSPMLDDDVPKPVAASAVQEAPYVLLAALQPAGELAAMPGDAGYLFALAKPAGSEIDYTLQVDSGSGYVEQAESDWSATAINASVVNKFDTTIAITAADRFDNVAIGSMVLWGDEICRLDAVDLIAGNITLGRGCADTVSAEHATGERLWVIDDSIALDATRYSASASISAKLLPRTTSQRLGLSDAAASMVTMASRATRPYPPAAVAVNGAAAPVEIFEAVDVTWLHRDRIASSAQLIDQAAGSSGPETGTTYTVRWYLSGVLDHTAAGVTGTTASYAPASDGLLRVEIEAVRDGLISWQFQVIECAYRVTPYSDYADQSGEIYADQSGNTYLG